MLARLTTPCECELVHPETGVRREVFEVGYFSDWLDPLFKHELRCRVIVTRRTVPAPPERVTVGKQSGDFVYELFLTSHPVHCLQTADVVQLYLQRGSFEQVLSDEDVEQDPDRWCSYTSMGQECWQIVSQWVWNLRLELGYVQQQPQMRQTHLLEDVPSHSQSAASASADECQSDEPIEEEEVESFSSVELTQEWANAHGRFSGKDFVLLDEATVRCPAGKLLRARSRLPLPNGNLRIGYSARIVECRSCPLAAQCIGRGASGDNPRQVSGIRQPIEPIHRPKVAPRHELEEPQTRPKQEPPRALRWYDVRGRALRRDWFRLLRRQQVTIEESDEMPFQLSREMSPPVLTRAQRTHARLSWQERQARNQNTRSSTQFRITLFGVAPQVAAYLNLASIFPSV